MTRDNTTSILWAIFFASAVFVVFKAILTPLVVDACSPHVRYSCLMFTPNMLPIGVGAIAFGISWILLDYANIKLINSLLISLALSIGLIALSLFGYL